jgi:hypothetical protein
MFLGKPQLLSQQESFSISEEHVFSLLGEHNTVVAETKEEGGTQLVLAVLQHVMKAADQQFIQKTDKRWRVTGKKMKPANTRINADVDKELLLSNEDVKSLSVVGVNVTSFERGDMSSMNIPRKIVVNMYYDVHDGRLGTLRWAKAAAAAGGGAGGGGGGGRAEVKKSTKNSISVDQLERVLCGKQSTILSSSIASTAVKGACFSLLSSESTLVGEASSGSAVDSLLTALTWILRCGGKVLSLVPMKDARIDPSKKTYVVKVDGETDETSDDSDTYDGTRDFPGGGGGGG